jgi:hypothetical protein
VSVDARLIITVKKKENSTITCEASRLREKKSRMHYAFVTA